MRCLEIGPGEHPINAEGYDTLDVNLGWTYLARWGYERLPIDDDYYDYVYSSHCIEHIDWHRTGFALSEAFRILKSGGHIELHTVDFSKVVTAYLQRKPGDPWRCNTLNSKLDPMLWMNSRVFSYDKDGTGNNLHRAMFDQASLSALMADAGFRSISRVEPPKNHHGRINLGLRGTKP